MKNVGLASGFTSSLAVILLTVSRPGLKTVGYFWMVVRNWEATSCGRSVSDTRMFQIFVRSSLRDSQSLLKRDGPETSTTRSGTSPRTISCQCTFSGCPVYACRRVLDGMKGLPMKCFLKVCSETIETPVPVSHSISRDVPLSSTSTLLARGLLTAMQCFLDRCYKRKFTSKSFSIKHLLEKQDRKVFRKVSGKDRHPRRELGKQNIVRERRNILFCGFGAEGEL